MFTLQQGQIAKLADLGMEEKQAMHMVDVFGNCNQALQHNGPVTFTGDFYAPNSRVIYWGTALYNWEYTEFGSPPSQGGSMAWVWVRRSTETGTVPDYDNEVKVYLPTIAGHDPNITAGDIVAYYKTSTGVFASAVNYGDGSIGDCKHNAKYDSNSSDYMKGWGVMDGTANATTLGGSGINMTDRILRQYDVIGNIGTTGGASSGVIPDHSTSDLNAALDDHAAGTTGSGGAHDHGGSTGSTALDDHYHSMTTTTAGVDGDNSTPVTLIDGTVSCTSDAKTAACSSDEDLSHDHTISNESAHTHSTPALTHNFSSALTHGGGSIDLIPPYGYVAMLERLDNSRNVVQKATA